MAVVAVSLTAKSELESRKRKTSVSHVLGIVAEMQELVTKVPMSQAIRRLMTSKLK